MPNNRTSVSEVLKSSDSAPTVQVYYINSTLWYSYSSLMENVYFVKAKYFWWWCVSINMIIILDTVRGHNDIRNWDYLRPWVQMSMNLPPPPPYLMTKPDPVSEKMCSVKLMATHIYTLCLPNISVFLHCSILLLRVHTKNNQHQILTSLSLSLSH
jgi:hypothetical protein